MGFHLGYLEPPTPELRIYAAFLFARRGEAQVVERVKVAVDGWTPQPNRCHDNAILWVARNPGYSVVNGWLYFDLPGLPWSRFVAHSVVSDETGRLLDVTPTETTTAYPFLASLLSDDEYCETEAILMAYYGDSNLDHFHGD